MNDELKDLLKSIRWLLFCVLVILSIMCAGTAYADTPGQGDYGQAWTEPLAETAPMITLVTKNPQAVPRTITPNKVEKSETIKDEDIIYHLPYGEDFWLYWDTFENTPETSPSAEATVTR